MVVSVMTCQASYSVPVIAFPQLLARNWWLLLLRRLAANIGGVLSLIWPGIGLVTLIILFMMPGAGAAALVWLIGGFVVAFGISMVGFALNIKYVKKS
jgi:uncharacterized membrane protein HdeD (DUF308 family)